MAVRTCFIEQVNSLYDFLDVVTDDITKTDEDELPEAVREPLNEAFELLVTAMNAIKEEERKKMKWQKSQGRGG